MGKEIGIEEMASFCKRTGFVFPSGEIYGGLAGFWDYGPRGVELKNKIKELWWKEFVKKREDIVGVDGAIITHPKTWYASGHVESFVDPIVECKRCHAQFRADHLIEDVLNIKTEGMSIEEMERIIRENNILCPKCKKGELTAPTRFNLMFKTFVGPKEGKESEAFLRPETAQNIFTLTPLVQKIMRLKFPFGIAQIGKAFRNEISPRHFMFRSREFEQMEIEYFIHPLDENNCPYMDEVDLRDRVKILTREMQEKGEEEVEMSIEEIIEKKIIQDEWHLYWLYKVHKFLEYLGLSNEKIRWRQHVKDELSHYSKDTWDIEYLFPFGWKEIHGMANRGSFDLTQHSKYSNKDLRVFDERTKQKIMGYVIEPSQGVDRLFLAILFEAYTEENNRVFLKLKPFLAPTKIGVFPLVSKDNLPEKAKEVYKMLKKEFYDVIYDESGSIGKRYARQDEIGTPYCITIDYQTLEDNTVTVRDRDTTKQERVRIDELVEYLREKLKE